MVRWYLPTGLQPIITVGVYKQAAGQMPDLANTKIPMLPIALNLPPIKLCPLPAHQVM